MPQSRPSDITRFYALLGNLDKLNGTRILSDCNGRQSWPDRGVYFFMEQGEVRLQSGDGPRIVRIGTHATTATSKTKLWQRLSQHKGQEKNKGGNHRGSIFRLLVGTALIAQNKFEENDWGKGNTASSVIKTKEHPLEMAVSTYIGQMPFYYLEIDGQAGTPSLRSYIECNSIALLSNYNKLAIDPPNPDWLGHSCNRPKVGSSGLWNQNYVDDEYDPAFLNQFEILIRKMEQNK